MDKAIIRIIVLLFICVYSNTALSAEIKLKWNPNTEVDIAGYKVHYGSAHRNYEQTLDTGITTAAYVISGLSAGTYYVAITAYDSSGNESGYSYELVKELKIGIPTGLMEDG